MTKPVKRAQIGLERTAAASSALDVTVDGFYLCGLELCTDPLGRGCDTLQIIHEGVKVGKIFHAPGMYGEDGGDWHYKFSSLITFAAYDIQRQKYKHPTGTFYDSGPHATPLEALTRFVCKFHIGTQECPEAFKGLQTQKQEASPSRA